MLEPGGVAVFNSIALIHTAPVAALNPQAENARLRLASQPVRP